jgi:hypothetical protein
VFFLFLGGLRANPGRRNSIAAKMAAEVALRADHRAAQIEKDRKFSEFLKTLELESARDTHSVEETKKTLVEVLHISFFDFAVEIHPCTLHLVNHFSAVYCCCCFFL